MCDIGRYLYTIKLESISLMQNLNPQCASWNFSAAGSSNPYLLFIASVECLCDINIQVNSHLATITGCSHWIISTLGGRGNWTTDGCELTGIDGNVVICQCNHLTNFAVLVVGKIRYHLSIAYAMIALSYFLDTEVAMQCSNLST